MRRPGFVVLAYVCVLHAAWGVAILADRRSVHTTTLNGFARLPQGVASGLFLGAAALAAWAMASHRAGAAWVAVVASAPQQLLLVAAAFSAATAMADSAFGDGVVRPRLFIVADQLPALLIVPAHAISVVLYHSQRHRP